MTLSYAPFLCASELGEDLLLCVLDTTEHNKWRLSVIEGGGGESRRGGEGGRGERELERRELFLLNTAISRTRTN